MKKVIIVDDEEDARKLLKEYISAHDEFSIIGEASNGVQAVELINKLRPDTIFLDIQLPGLNGFQVITQLDEIPEIIFSTAYDQYAVRAFEVHAIDYLLKPYDKIRFENTLVRLLDKRDNMVELTEELLQTEVEFPTRVILNKGLRKIMINVSDIVYAEAFGDYTKVYTDTEALLSTKGISLLLERLDPKYFIRLHRSHFVNIASIKELKKLDRYYYAILSDKKSIRISESYLPRIKKIML